MPTSCDDVIVTFPIYGYFGAIQKPNSGCIVYKTYIFIKSNLLSYETENRTKTVLTILLWAKILVLPKHADFWQKDADISKFKRALVLKGIFPKTTYVCVFKFLA